MYRSLAVLSPCSIKHYNDSTVPEISGPEDPEFYFVNLVMTLSTMALGSLGEIPDPRTGKGRLDLARARTNINMLVSLKRKTQGRLSVKESKILQQFIDDLQGKYMESLKLGSSGSNTSGLKIGSRDHAAAKQGLEKNIEGLVSLIKRKRKEMDLP